MIENQVSESTDDVMIIIPTYNSASTLNRCLQSVRNNTRLNSLIIVDSNSSDLTLKIAKDFGARIFSFPGYPSTKRNFGVLNSSSRFLLFLDSDEILKKDTIDECVYSCKDEAEFVCFNFLFIGNGFWSSCSALLRNVLSSQLKTINDVHPIPRFIKRETFLSVGQYNKNLLLGEDWELYQRLLKSGVKEASFRPTIYHIESHSLKKMIAKEFKYGRSTKRLRKQEILPWSRYGLVLTIKEILFDSETSSNIKVGALILLIIRSSVRLSGKIFS